MWNSPLHIYANISCFCCHLDDPPGQNDKVRDRPSWEEISVAPPEHRGGKRSELGLRPRLVHQLDVLVPSDAKKTKAVDSGEVGEGVVAAFLLHDRLEHHDVVLEGGDPEALDHHVGEVVREEHQVPPAVVDQLLVVPLLVLFDMTYQVASISGNWVKRYQFHRTATPELVPDAELPDHLVVLLRVVPHLGLHTGRQGFPSLGNIIFMVLLFYSSLTVLLRMNASISAFVLDILVQQPLL